MKKHPARIPACQLPIYDRAVARYPQLAHTTDAYHFCKSLSYLAAVPDITVKEYFKIATVAAGKMWPTD